MEESIVFKRKVPKIDLPLEVDLPGLFAGRSQFVKTNKIFKIGERIELVKSMGKSFYVYPVIITKTDKNNGIIFTETDYSLSLYEIADMMSAKILSRRKKWSPAEHITSVEKDKRKIIQHSSGIKNWHPVLDDFSERDWGVICYYLF